MNTNIILIGAICILLAVGTFYAILYFRDRKKVKKLKDQALNDLESMLMNTIGGGKREDQEQCHFDSDDCDVVFQFDDMSSGSNSESISERKSE